MSFDIHARAQELVNQSRGRITHAEALAELSRRGVAARKAKRRAKFGVLHLPLTNETETVERPYRLPYIDN